MPTAVTTGLGHLIPGSLAAEMEDPSSRICAIFRLKLLSVFFTSGMVAVLSREANALRISSPEGKLGAMLNGEPGMMHGTIGKPQGLAKGESIGVGPS